MAKRLFIDLETTGDGSSKYHDIIEINAIVTDNGNTTAEFNALYGLSSRSVFSGGRNYHKAVKHKHDGRKTSFEGIEEFEVWLNTHIGEDKAFLVSYNCNWDKKHLDNWFWRNKKEPITRFIYTNCACSMTLCSCRYDKFLKLHDCATKLGIQVDYDQLHTARYDNTLNRRIYYNLANKIKN